MAEFTFDVTDTVNSANAIAGTLDRSEITKVNGQIATSSPQTVTFHHQAAQQASVEPSTVSADGKSFSVKINGQIGGTYRIEVSYDLHDWTPIQTVGSQGGAVTVSDGTTENSTVRFYRAVLVN